MEDARAQECVGSLTFALLIRLCEVAGCINAESIGFSFINPLLSSSPFLSV